MTGGAGADPNQNLNNGTPPPNNGPGPNPGEPPPNLDPADSQLARVTGPVTSQNKNNTMSFDLWWFISYFPGPDNHFLPVTESRRNKTVNAISELIKSQVFGGQLTVNTQLFANPHPDPAPTPHLPIAGGKVPVRAWVELPKGETDWNKYVDKEGVRRLMADWPYVDQIGVLLTALEKVGVKIVAPAKDDETVNRSLVDPVEREKLAQMRAMAYRLYIEAVTDGEMTVHESGPNRGKAKFPRGVGLRPSDENSTEFQTYKTKLESVIGKEPSKVDPFFHQAWQGKADLIQSFEVMKNTYERVQRGEVNTFTYKECIEGLAAFNHKFPGGAERHALALEDMPLATALVEIARRKQELESRNNELPFLEVVKRDLIEKTPLGYLGGWRIFSLFGSGSITSLASGTVSAIAGGKVGGIAGASVGSLFGPVGTAVGYAGGAAIGGGLSAWLGLGVGSFLDKVSGKIAGVVTGSSIAGASILGTLGAGVGAFYGAYTSTGPYLMGAWTGALTGGAACLYVGAGVGALVGIISRFRKHGISLVTPAGIKKRISEWRADLKRDRDNRKGELDPDNNKRRDPSTAKGYDIFSAIYYRVRGLSNKDLKEDREKMRQARSDYVNQADSSLRWYHRDELIWTRALVGGKGAVLRVPFSIFQGGFATVGAGMILSGVRFMFESDFRNVMAFGHNINIPIATGLAITTLGTAFHLLDVCRIAKERFQESEGIRVDERVKRLKGQVVFHSVATIESIRQEFEKNAWGRKVNLHTKEIRNVDKWVREQIEEIEKMRDAAGGDINKMTASEKGKIFEALKKLALVKDYSLAEILTAEGLRPKKDENGQVLFKKDENGQVVKDERGNPVTQKIPLFEGHYTEVMAHVFVEYYAKPCEGKDVDPKWFFSPRKAENNFKYFVQGFYNAYKNLLEDGVLNYGGKFAGNAQKEQDEKGVRVAEELLKDYSQKTFVFRHRPLAFAAWVFERFNASWLSQPIKIFNPFH